jgi:RsiW-degrading membrane proteinase PrsW (M82 family)
MLLVYRSRHFNEKFDGIVYAVFVSLGFAAVENILYVFQEGVTTGFLRAVTAVPAHAIFGIVMGYYLGFAKLEPENRGKNIWNAFMWPFLLHGFYDYVLMSEYKFLLLLFLPLLFYMYRTGFRRMKSHSDSSRFNPENMDPGL